MLRLILNLIYCEFYETNVSLIVEWKRTLVNAGAEGQQHSIFIQTVQKPVCGLSVNSVLADFNNTYVWMHEFPYCAAGKRYLIILAASTRWSDWEDVFSLISAVTVAHIVLVWIKANLVDGWRQALKSCQLYAWHCIVTVAVGCSWIDTHRQWQLSFSGDYKLNEGNQFAIVFPNVFVFKAIQLRLHIFYN